MRFLISVTLLALIGVGPASAQSVTVQSGQHPNFARLVFPATTPGAWKFEKSDQVVKVFGDEQLQFDRSGIFDLISRNRIADVTSQRAGQFSFTLNCDCEVTMFTHNNRYVVIDVADQTIEPTIANKTVLKSPIIDKAESTTSSTQIFPLVFYNQKNNQVVETENVSSSGPETMQGFDPIELRNQLSRQLAGAASQGLLQPSKQSFQAGVSNEKDDSKKIDIETAFTIPTADPELGVSARTSLDELTYLLGNSNGRAVDSVCSPPYAYQLSNWVTARDFGTSLGTIRNQQADSIDAFSQKIRLKLARHYLFFGFGAEALASLSKLPNTASEVLMLSQLARFLEDPNGKQYPFFKQFEDCEDELWLWSFLANNQTASKLTEEKAKALVAVFNLLPVHLQSHLSPIMTRRLSEAGSSSISAVFADVLSRTVNENQASLQVQVAQIAIEAGQPLAAKQQLENIKKSNDIVTVRAFLEAMQLNLGLGAKPSIEDIILLDSYIREFKGHELEDDMEILTSLARIRRGDIRNGLMRFEKNDGDRAVLSGILTSLAEQGSLAEVMALATYFAEQNEIPIELKLAVDVVEERMRDAGFEMLANRVQKKPELQLSNEPVVPIENSNPISESTAVTRFETETFAAERKKKSTLTDFKSDLENAKKLRDEIDIELNQLHLPEINS